MQKEVYAKKYIEMVVQKKNILGTMKKHFNELAN